MSNVLAYKGYFAPVEFDAEQHVLTGMVAGIRDAIVFEGSTAEEVEQCFHDAVDDYLEFCAEKGKEYCSKICCMYTAKHAMLIRDKYPDTEVYVSTSTCARRR